MRAFVLVALVAAACLLAIRPTTSPVPSIPSIPSIAYALITFPRDRASVVDTIPQSRLDSLARTTACLMENMALTPQWLVTIAWAALRGEVTATTLIHPEYRQARIEIDSVKVAEFNTETLKRLMVHELMHLPVYDLAVLAMAADSARGKRMGELLVVTVERWPLWWSVCIWRTVP